MSMRRAPGRRRAQSALSRFSWSATAWTRRVPSCGIQVRSCELLAEQLMKIAFGLVDDLSVLFLICLPVPRAPRRGQQVLQNAAFVQALRQPFRREALEQRRQ